MESRNEWSNRQLIKRITGLPVPSAKQEAQWAEQEREARARYKQQQEELNAFQREHPEFVVKAILWNIVSWLILGGIVWGIYALVQHH